MNVGPRQGQVLKLLLAGYGNREIGKILQISPNTVKHHMCNLFLKYGVTGGNKRVKLAVLASGK